jgi:hypothetical protein
MNVRRTFKYRLYHNRRNKRLQQRLDIAGIIWNHMVALQRRYYQLTGGYISRNDMQRHLATLRRRSPEPGVEPQADRVEQSRKGKVAAGKGASASREQAPGRALEVSAPVVCSF